MMPMPYGEALRYVEAKLDAYGIVSYRDFDCEALLDRMPVENGLWNLDIPSETFFLAAQSFAHEPFTGAKLTLQPDRASWSVDLKLGSGMRQLASGLLPMRTAELAGDLPGVVDDAIGKLGLRRGFGTWLSGFNVSVVTLEAVGFRDALRDRRYERGQARIAHKVSALRSPFLRSGWKEGAGVVLRLSQLGADTGWRVFAHRRPLDGGKADRVMVDSGVVRGAAGGDVLGSSAWPDVSTQARLDAALEEQGWQRGVLLPALGSRMVHTTSCVYQVNYRMGSPAASTLREFDRMGRVYSSGGRP